MKEKHTKSTRSNVSLSDIDLKPGPFTMSFHFNLEPLKGSIDKFGILNPPYLLSNADGKYQVVAGYRRLLAAHELGWSSVLCEILPGDFSPVEALLLNFHDNLVHRHLNHIEKAMLLRSFTRFLGKEHVIPRFMPLLGLPPNNRTLELLLGLLDLEETIRNSIAAECLSVRIAGFMTGLESEDRLCINDLFTSLRWSFHLQWKVIEWTMEIASRQGLSIRAVLNEPRIRELLHHGTMNDPQKVKAIVKLLKARRFPSLVEAEGLFKRGLSRLSLPSGVTVTPPPFFEGVTYRLEVSFTRGQDLKEKLAELSHKPGLDTITDFWKGTEHG
jgi:hypothetical protein